MPALPPVPKVLRIDCIQTVSSNTRVRNRFFLQYTTAASATDLTTLANLVGTKWLARISPNQSSVGKLTNVQITDLTSASSNQVIVTVNEVGLDCAAVISAGGAAVVRFKILRRYRGGHPRFYLGGICSAELSGAVALSGAYAAGLATAFGAFINDLVTGAPAGLGALSHVNVNYFSGFTVVTNPTSHRARNVPSLRLVAGVPTPQVDTVIGYSVNPNLASQRRRNLQSA